MSKPFWPSKKYAHIGRKIITYVPLAKYFNYYQVPFYDCLGLEWSFHKKEYGLLQTEAETVYYELKESNSWIA